MTPTKRMSRRSLGLAVALALATSVVAGPALAHDPVIGVDPAEVDLILAPGQSADITKTVHTPEIPPTPDIFLLFDTTSSMTDDIATMQAKVGELITTIGGQTLDPAYGVGSYEDFPFETWGGELDEAYELFQSITTNTTDVTNAINALTPLGFGADGPESGFEGLYQALTGVGRDLPQADGSAPDGDFTDAGEIAPGQGAGFRPDASQVIIVLGDAPFHDPGDPPTSTQFAAGYPGASEADVDAELGDVSLFCLVPAGPGAGPTTECTALGGMVFDVGVSSEDIVDAIIAALGEVEVEVTPQGSCDDANVTVSWNPASQTVVSGEDAIFTETVTAEPGAPQGTTVECTVEFLVDGELLDGFTQTITVEIPDVTAPTASCDPGTNPHGKRIPRATNEDGFFLLTALDNLDPDPVIFVVDSGSGMVFGPYPSGTTIKYVEAPGAKPKSKKMGSTHGQAGAVWVKIIGKGDAYIEAVDDADNVSEQVWCLVPPPPK